MDNTLLLLSAVSFSIDDADAMQECKWLSFCIIVGAFGCVYDHDPSLLQYGCMFDEFNIFSKNVRANVSSKCVVFDDWHHDGISSLFSFDILVYTDFIKWFFVLCMLNNVNA